jgi:hypothetical protein
MPHYEGRGPHVGQIVTYTETAHTLFYAAMITNVNTDGTVRLNAFPPGSAMADHDNVTQNVAGAANGTWRYMNNDSGV